MGFEIIRGTHRDARKVIDWLLKIYNDKDRVCFGFFDMENPESVVVVYKPSVGGMVLDLVGNLLDPNNKAIVCHYLCVEEDRRGKGFARLLIAEAERLAKLSNMPFMGAYVDGSDQIELWKRLGFPYQSNVGYTVTMFKRSLHDVFDEQKVQNSIRNNIKLY
ncbi:GNAT family N-acetyltransferase [Photobacterium damselae]|uniref:GNAT family N-acetyltransferase n=1 Tax=Photobacterium damselae TaxID=38293 RepID=UPI001F384E3C|nr:GNAT family N-acetyltransferase [Photobacterium damselae]UKA12903.1 GNAT family N-acetyltransferase [Photobacterium damselae subsp. damselae]